MKLTVLPIQGAFLRLLTESSATLRPHRQVSLIQRFIILLPLFVLIVTLWGSVTSLCLQISYVYFRTHRYSIPLIRQLSHQIPYISEHLRGFFSILWLTIYREKIRQLLQAADEFVSRGTAPCDIKPTFQRWKLRSVLLTVLICAMHIGVTWVDWLYDLYVWDTSLLGEDFMEPLPIKMTTLQYFIQWSLWVEVPFMISQMLHSAAIILAWILGGALNGLIVKIETSTCAVQSTTLTLSEYLKQMKLWRKSHVDILLFCESLKYCFGGLFFTVFSCDFLAVAGYVARLLNEPSETASALFVSRLIGNAVVFASFQTVFVIPLVLVNEQVI
ncbi:hypothetical protein RvY_16641 [Ramazzottius varieornatus]|uniref:Odorant receptor n=1 Tax=Ramazzottius varieornatus TaxID=947166 RepID=A0A1D1VZ75_RAMVA|nr:hypothetical protein RvY_16641 [Ramazzottius varieornatus]